MYAVMPATIWCLQAPRYKSSMSMALLSVFELGRSGRLGMGQD
jgi:hypothetical protein